MNFQLNPKSGVPIYRQIQDQIRFGIASGLLSAGEQLPTVRALAVELKVNPNTVIRAYSELEHEGVLTSEQGSGTFIGARTPAPLAEADRAAKLQGLCTEFLAHAARFGFSAEDVTRSIQEITRRAAS